jgi:hypothetical protein
VSDHALAIVNRAREKRVGSRRFGKRQARPYLLIFDKQAVTFRGAGTSNGCAIRRLPNYDHTGLWARPPLCATLHLPKE